jgi:hypothetical protein
MLMQVYFEYLPEECSWYGIPVYIESSPASSMSLAYGLHSTLWDSKHSDACWYRAWYRQYFAHCCAKPPQCLVSNFIAHQHPVIHGFFSVIFWISPCQCFSTVILIIWLPSLSLFVNPLSHSSHWTLNRHGNRLNWLTSWWQLLALSPRL